MHPLTTPAAIPVAGPWVTDREIRYVADAAERAWHDQAGLYVRRFEQAFARYLDVRHAVALPHCTAGLHLALLALEVGPGDEVIVPDVTWIASSAPISYVGATPVFADVDETTWCLSEASVRDCLTPRTKAIIAVDLYGGMPRMDALTQLAAERNVAVIEDAAEAIGSQYHGRKAGSWGTLGVFSFHGSKTLTTGEGGMLVTNSDAIHDRVQFLRDHGRRPGDVTFCNAEIAYKYRMSDLQAAFGLAQLERIEELVARKREIFGWYADELRPLDGLALNAEPPGTVNSYWMTTALVQAPPDVDKFRLVEQFRSHGIATRPFFSPLSSLPAYRHLPQAHAAQRRNAVSYRISPRGVNLPSGAQLTRDDVRRVCRTLDEVLRPCGAGSR